MKKKFLVIIQLLVMSILLPLGVSAASAPKGIYGNGTNGIYIDINSAPYTTFAGYSYGQYAYGPSGCAWFASARVNELTGKGNTIRAGTSWWKNAATLGYTTGQTIRAHSIACYENHVTIVERVDGETATISEGGYQSLSSDYGYCRIATMSVSKVSSARGGNFLGYVYLDDIQTTSTRYKITAQDGLWMRSQPNLSSSSEEVRVLPAGAIIEVTQTSGTWGYGTYSGASGWFSLNYAVRTDESCCDPQGYVYSVNGGFRQVSFSGWAFDLDDANAGIQINVYIDDNLVKTLTADQYCAEPNIDDAYHHHGIGDYHGFSGTVETTLIGPHKISLWAIDVGGGNNVCLGDYYGIDIQGDNTGPAISDIRVYDVDTTGYTVSCTVTDDSGVDRVQFPSWTEANGQDDLAAEWWTNPAVTGSRNGNTWTFRVKTSDHNEEEGKYLTHIYAYDIYGNSSDDGTSAVIDKHPPQVNMVQVGYDWGTDILLVEYSGNNLDKVDHAQMKIYESGTSADDAEWNEVVYRDGKLVGERKMELPKVHDDIEYKIISDLTWKQQEVLKDTLFYTISAQHPDFFVTLDYGDMPMYNGLKTGFIQSPDAPYMWLDVTPVWDGYTFLGWFTQKQGGEQVTSSTICTREEDHTLYAHWEKADPCAAGHTFSSWSEKSVATCTSKATHRAVCGVCGQEYGDVVEYGSLANHQYGDWNIVREPTVEQEGLKQRTCTVCGKVDEKLIDRLPPVVDENAPQIIVDTVTAKAGKTVTMNLSLKNNPGVNSVRLHLSYDTEALTLTDVKDLGILGEFTMDSSQMTKLPLIISWEGDKFENNFTEDGAFAALTFEVKPGVPEGQYSVSVSYDEEQYDIANTELNNVHLDIVNGGVTVKNIEPGDTDGDGSITNRDRMILSRYLAGWSGYDEMIDVSAADVDCDGNVTNRDRMILSRYLAGWAGYETLPYLK